MVRLLPVNKDLSYLKSEFEEFDFELLATEGNEHISCIVCSSDNIEAIAERWEHVVGSVAGTYQASLTDEFSKWNIYLVFFTKYPLDIPLKYRIENNKFSMRKIVIDQNSIPLGQTIHEYLNSEILGLDLQLLTQDSNAVVGPIHTRLSQLIESLGEIPLDQKLTSFELRASQLNDLIERL